MEEIRATLEQMTTQINQKAELIHLALGESQKLIQMVLDDAQRINRESRAVADQTVASLNQVGEYQEGLKALAADIRTKWEAQLKASKGLLEVTDHLREFMEVMDDLQKRVAALEAGFEKLERGFE